MYKTKILIVEDEAVIAMELEDRLDQMGYSVIGMASNGEVAIRKIASKKPDLILMDINLRGPLDGIEVTREVNARFDVPVIYVTAYSDDATLRKARETAPSGFLFKPFRDNELRAALEVALNRSSDNN